MLKKVTIIGMIAILILLFAAAPASAHNLMLASGSNITDAMEAEIEDYFIKTGTVKSIILIHGHGVDYDFGNLTESVNVTITAPDGTKYNVSTQSATETVDIILSGEKEQRTFQKINYNFTQSGTYYLTAAVKEGNTTEYAKTMIYVGDGTWSDWAANLNNPIEFVPYTRVSGIGAGEVLHGKLYSSGSGAGNIKYYLEPFMNATTAKATYDELSQFNSTGESIYLLYSKRSMTDEFGNFVITVPAEGVWTIVASGEAAADGTNTKATYTFPVLPQIYGSDASASTDKETPGFSVLLAVFAVIGVGAFLFTRRK
ncbi:hypothetical protein MmiAt1_13680 [Methanimicrococcus sp. At1]|uniref:DUF4198 domain-containing protein n=1 Tax=Methanimicrococcus hacksteinii TaxID=3028293 RepID=A0ABU3VQT5_9EURY|nr:DUF4198 domain-containing protein [Methanimicrococcus sp. At1]MDV0445773.1 hypothetical protein [Methanimicrococcus sp. At1]